MIRILQWLFFGHVHKWKTIARCQLEATDTGEIGFRYTQQCETCGTIVKRDLI